MSLYSQFDSNTDKETNGVKIVMGNNEDGTEISFILCRMGGANKSYQKALEQATRPYRRQIQAETMSEDLSEEIFMKVFCKTILKGWSNVRDRNNTELPFEFETARKIFTELPELYRELQAQSSNIANYRDEVLKEEAKN